MTKKVLIAEDSQTVRKVIGFTLENEPFELVNVPDENSLFSILGNTEIDLVVLDMGLSDKKSGYDLVREIKLKYPKIAVLSLFGTFDTIDEKAFKNSGSDEKIIKPFDSVDFVSKCKKLTQLEKKEAVEEEPPLNFQDTTEEWELKAPEIQQKVEPVGSDFESWGFDIPEVIAPTVPDESLLEEGAKLLDAMAKETEEEIFPEIIPPLKPEVQFPLQETKFNFDAAVDETDPELFWAKDDVKKEEVKEAPAKEGYADLLEALKPFLEEQIRKYCHQVVERVAWEIIPDLAENLIKKEIKEISKSVD